MKNKFLIITGLLIAGLLSSCGDDFMEAPAKSTLDEELIFSTPGLTKGAIDGIVEPMMETNSYRGRFIPFYGTNTDTEFLYDSENDGDAEGELARYVATANNGSMNRDDNAWAMMYKGIERANLCIRGLRTYGNPEPGTELGQYLGEALTLRALYYADLMKAWGDVVARFEPINSETVYLPKSSRDDVYKQIIEDLDEASTLVAWPNQSALTTSVERINKAFVKGLRARLAMVASGYQQYPDGIRRSKDPELSVANMYQLALAECQSIIGSGTVSLFPTYEGLWRNLNEENLTAGLESLWEIPFAPGRGRVTYTFGIRHLSKDQHTAQARGGSAGPPANLFYDFDEADERRDISCIPYEWGTAVDGFSKQEYTDSKRWYFGKYRYEWMNRIVSSDNDDGMNKIYMRYAEVLLIAAEAANELQGPGAAAPYLKELRSRAFKPADHSTKVDTYVNALGSKQDMLNAIIEEHKFEFTGEMERKQALIRWNLLGTNLAETKVKLATLKARDGEYSDVPSTIYYKYAADGETLITYGLNRGETFNPGADYTAINWDRVTQDRIDYLYSADPDTKQFWPIWQVFIDGSNNTLTNDYGY
ncbi:RagB/SusD family nutrient uptake outer membrane protein [Tamlana sp. s12]|uniref:RagB/SusD family nutrient uptake outer membrane protein n=1 Tax=Tamlana sp. s12 TaxID=1630406 RepID=UPI0007FD4624|nr:RagB/SusD family nutrient uptake outer membrane protein [Tamlana sp. s12]OBQ52217.1 carbohydrate-binding protein SusD [Tamlana sp. s12]QQY82327.1 RagB/SusD family nutrient uptake outer membrane protein [Tamlana sp. s12]